MTLEKLAWIGLGILTSFHIVLYAVEIIRVWIRSQNNTTENTDGEK